MGRQRQRAQGRARGASRTRRRARKNISTAVVHIKSSFNNTIVSVTDQEGNVIAWESAGTMGFKGSRKSTPYAANLTTVADRRSGVGGSGWRATRDPKPGVIGGQE